MLPTSLRENLTPSDDAPDLIEGATDVIEAETAEAALAEVHERLGADARIVDARRELRGGVGGFFAREVVQLHVAPGNGATSTPDPASAGSSGSLDGEGRAGDAHEGTRLVGEDPVAVGSPVDRLLADATDGEDFATFLRRRMAEGDESAAPTPPSGPERYVAPAPWLTDPTRWSEEPQPMAPGTPASPPAGGAPTPGWSQEVLMQLGLPADLVRELALTASDTDLVWTEALATAVTDACGGLPQGQALLVGPHAEQLSTMIDVPAARSRMWFDALRDGRWLHLVVGGEGWRDHLSAGPQAVSWTRPDDLPEAVRCAVELGLTLGYGPLGGVVRRARPLDVALAIRALVDGR